MKTSTALITLVVIAILGYGLYAILPGNETTTDTPITEPLTTEDSMESEWNMNAAGLGIKIVTKGSGPAAEVGDTVTVHYTGTLENGTKFDSSVDRGTPFVFTLGENRVIAGWEQGVLGMQVGEKRSLNIPAELGYGAAGAGGGLIPPNATLLFDVELLAIN